MAPNRAIHFPAKDDRFIGRLRPFRGRSRSVRFGSREPGAAPVQLLWSTRSAFTSPFEAISRRQRHELLEQSQVGLSLDNRWLIHLRYVRGWTFPMIADLFECSDDAVYKMHGRVLGKLRDNLAAMGVKSMREI
jgi:DNA-directed RNA polymerase specialized sigma24 family protein